MKLNRAVLGLAAAMFFYFYEVILRVSPSVMTEQLMEHFQISATMLGVLATSYYMSYFILQIPGGMIIDRFGVRRVIAISSMICVIGTLIFCTQNNFYLALLGRLMIGIGSSCAFISCLKLATDGFKPHYFPLIVGLTNMMGTLGATFSSKPLAILVNNYGWQNACFSLAIVGTILAPIIWFSIRDKERRNSEKTFSESFLSIAKNRQMWLLGVIGGFLYLPITAFAELWGVPYVMKVYNINNQEASKATVLVFIGMAIGGWFFSYVAHWLKSYKNTMLIGSFFASILFVMASNAHIFSYNEISLIMFLIGFFIGAENLVFTIARNITPDSYNGTAMGFINGVVSLIGFIFQPFLGKILDIFWNGEIAENGVRIYSLQNYQYAIYVLTSTIVISVIMVMFIRDNYKKTA